MREYPFILAIKGDDIQINTLFIAFDASPLASYMCSVRGICLPYLVSLREWMWNADVKLITFEIFIDALILEGCSIH